MYKTLHLSFLTGRKRHNRVKKSSMGTRVSLTFLKLIKAQMKSKKEIKNDKLYKRIIK